jgi:hypothetical protein
VLGGRHLLLDQLLLLGGVCFLDLSYRFQGLFPAGQLAFGQGVGFEAPKSV